MKSGSQLYSVSSWNTVDGIGETAIQRWTLGCKTGVETNAPEGNLTTALL